MFAALDEVQRRIYKRLKLCGGIAYDRLATAKARRDLLTAVTYILCRYIIVHEC